MFSKLHYSVTMITEQKQNILYALVQKHLIKVHVCHSSNLLYQGFAQRYFFLGIYNYIAKQSLKGKIKLESVCIFYNAPGR